MAPTTLNPGDVAIVGFRSGAPDGLAFVTFKDLDAGTMLGFTDASYQQPGTPGSWRGTENFAVWTAASAIPAGTIVVLSFPNSPTPATADSGSVSGALNGLSNSGDQIFVYQRSDGTVATTSPFTASATQTTWNAANGGSLLFGINLASTGGFVTSGTANLNSTNTSYLPDAGSGAGALVLGTTALNITNTGIVANAQYNGARSGLSSADFKAQILNQNNWVAVDAATGALNSTDLTFAGGGGLPNVNLSVSAVTGSEASGTVITVTATAASAVTGDQTVSLNVTGTGITAADYALSASTITIPNGATTGTVTFTVVDDAIAEGTETAVLTLSNPSAGITLGGTVSQSIAIEDNDASLPQFSLLQKIGGFTSANGAEIPAFDPGSDRLFVVAGNTVEILSVSNTGALALTGALTPGFTPPAGTNAVPNSVAVNNGIVAVAYAVVDATTRAQQVGRVSFYNAADGTFLNSVAVGFLPDMLTFTPDGTKVLVANEGEPNSYGQATSFDPEGSVSVIDLANGVASATVQNATFTSFNSQLDALKAAGVRITGPGATVAQDLEPEYIAVASDGLTAQVTLQENNAIAVLDIASATITQIIPLGVKDHSQPGNGLDASDRDGGINIQNWPVFGLYQPDAIASYTANGQTYYITANEGDARDYTGFAEEVRLGAATLDPTLFPNAATLQNPANLGRLTISQTTSDKDGDGDIDRIEVFGARSFSIRDANGALVFDSGDQFEQITATLAPTLFNSEGATATFDGRSDNKGPEPEGVVVGVINNRTYAFIGLERVGDVIVYDVTNPSKPVFVQYVDTPEDLGAEGLVFIAAADSPTGKPLLATANEVSNTVALFEITPPVRISDIQGASHTSPLNGQTVSGVPGIVTALRSNGFYLQDPNPDGSDATSDGIFVFTSSAPTVRVGDLIQVSGRVSEFRPGGATSANLTTTQISSPSITILSSGNALPTAIVLGNGGRTIPNSVINDDGTGNVETSGTFDFATDGIDFYESLEGMLVQINNPLATSPTNNFGEIWLLADNGANATGRTERGGSLISTTDFNPERIQIDDTLFGAGMPQVNVGAQLSTIVGVLDYSFNNFEVLPTSAPTVVAPSPLQREVTALIAGENDLTIANFNVENLSPRSGAAQFNALASAIVTNLKAPDILTLEEIQDNNGSTNDAVVDASLTYQTLIDAIVAAGGPTYEFRQIDPIDDTNGGQPGGNIRVGFLFNPDRVSFVDRPGGSATTNTTVLNANGDPVLSASPGLLDPTNLAFDDSRKPLVGEFVFNGQTVFVVANHFNSKGGDQPLFGPSQPPVLNSEVQRLQQAAIVRDFVQSVLAADPNANVVVAGDLNDFEFSNPVNLVESAGLVNLIETLPANERYTYNFQGNAQTLDYILVSGNLLNQLNGYDVVHFNSEFADQISDHDPSVARFTLLRPNGIPVANSDTATTDEDMAVTFNVLTNDTDADNDTLTIASFTNPTNGALINNGAGSFTYTPGLNFNGSDSFTYTISDGKGGTASAPVSITINPVNDAPVNTVPGSQTAVQDSVLIFSAATGNAISIADVDVAEGEAQVKLSVTNGALNLGSTSGLTVVAGSNSSATLTVKGTLSSLNTALNVLQFAPDATSVINGAATLTILTDDLGNTGAGGAQTDTDTVAIAINPANLIRGNGGNNTLIGTLRSDTIYAGGGNDTVFGLGGNDIVFGEGGNDKLFGGLGNDYIDGGSGNDTITDLGGNNIIFGGSGNDTIVVGFGSNLIDGGAGNDTIYLSFGEDTIVLARGNGNDTVYNYNAGSTRFSLGAGLTFDELTIVQSGGSTSIRAGGERLASLVGVQANSVTASSFITA